MTKGYTIFEWIPGIPITEKYEEKKVKNISYSSLFSLRIFL